jgi:hypothetical protein
MNTRLLSRVRDSLLTHLFPQLLDEAERLRVQIGHADIGAQRARYGSLRHLWEAEVSVFSQWGEDGILDYICHSLHLDRPVAIEYGAGNFKECNTRYLTVSRNAAVVAVDGRKDLPESVRKTDGYWRTTILPRCEWITPESAYEIYQNAVRDLGKVNIISLDIDGNDYWVAAALPLAEVDILVVEYNALFGGSQPVSVPRDDNFVRASAHYSHLYFGASLGAFAHLAKQHGLAFAGTNRANTNAFFVSESRLHELRLESPLMENLARYVDLRVRESRNQRGNLDYCNRREATARISNMPLVNVATGARTTVEDVTEFEGLDLRQIHQAISSQDSVRLLDPKP